MGIAGKHVGIFFSVAIFSCSAAVADDICPPPLQAPTPEQVRQAQSKAQDRGMLWSISKGGHTSYLYGTMHMGKLDWSMPGPSLLAALRATNKIAMEINLTDPAELSVMKKSNDLGLAKVSVSEEQQARLERLMQENCAQDAEIQASRNSHPVLRAISLSATGARKQGLEVAYASELILLGFAMQSKREIVGLETAKMQLEALIGRDDLKAQELFNQMVSNYDSRSAKMQAVLQRVTRDWAESKVADLEQYGQWCECRETATEREFMSRLIDERNVSMATQLDELHSKGDKLLAAVGMLHLIGEESLPKLLKARGYEVQQLVPTLSQP